MKKLFISPLLLAFSLMACTTETAKVSNAKAPEKIETLIVERAVIIQRDGTRKVLLFTDGSTKEINAYNNKRRLIQKGDTVIMQNGRISDIRFKRDVPK